MTPRRGDIRDESGFALVSVLILMIVGTLFAVAAWGASKDDIVPSTRDRQAKEAYAAAEAGLNFYLFRLGQNNAYWTNCDQIPAPNASDPVSLEGTSTLNWRNVQGSSTSYAIELMRANVTTRPTTGGWCTPGDTATASLIDGPTGTLQIRSTGRSGSLRRTVVATLRRTGFLDYLYFTDFETEDPQVSGASGPCNVYRRAGRSATCTNIVFGDTDAVRGPFHTNDDFIACGTPEFGRPNMNDAVEVSAPSPGWQSGCGSTAVPVFYTPLTKNAKPLQLPANNQTLATVAAPGYLFSGTTQITFNGASMTVINNNTTTVKALPANGVIYVQAGTGSNCTPAYSGTYSEPACTANVYIKGTYSRSVTIGSDRDIIVNGDFKRDPTSGVVAGLVANNFIRVYHPVSGSTSGSCPNGTTNATTAPYGPALGSTTIEAAILSVGHSFLVDNYRCGAALGTLTIKGAVAQLYRGTVGTVGGTGYIKDYNYDDRLRVIGPPYFLDPVQSSWRDIRYNEQVPPRQGG